jgi:CubicO group peptidase (beta-lactamase class C family)
VVTSLLANQKPLWAPGSKSSYHAFTFGHLVGELVRRCDPAHRTVGTFFHEEVTVKLGLEKDMMIGFRADNEELHEDLHNRCADVFNGHATEAYKFEGGSEFQKKIAGLIAAYDAVHRARVDSASVSEERLHEAAVSLMQATSLNPQRPCERANTRVWREAELPASGGYTNARALALLYSALASDAAQDKGVIGRRALDRATHQEVWAENTFPGSKFGGGFVKQVLGSTRAPQSFGHGGLGGHVSFADPEHELGFGYTMNKCVMAGRDGARALGQELALAVYECLKGTAEGDEEARLVTLAGTQGSEGLAPRGEKTGEDQSRL